MQSFRQEYWGLVVQTSVRVFFASSRRTNVVDKERPRCFLVAPGMEDLDRAANDLEVTASMKCKYKAKLSLGLHT